MARDQTLTEELESILHACGMKRSGDLAVELAKVFAGWQPIEDVPETDAYHTVDIWVEGKGRMPNCYCRGKRWIYKVNNQVGQSVEVIMPVYPTHWMHVPAAPEGALQRQPVSR